MVPGLCRNRDGNVALTFAIIAPAHLVAAGLAVDFQSRPAMKDQLQDAADNLALRAAREMLLENATRSTVEPLIRAWAEAQYAERFRSFSIAPVVDDAANTAQVRIEAAPPTGFFLIRLFPAADSLVEAEATAQAQGVTNVCVIALEEDHADAIRASSTAKLSAPACAIMSNSASNGGIDVSGASHITAKFICSAGGYRGGPANYSPLPISDCPAYVDPLAARTPPTVGGCDFTKLKIGPDDASLNTVDIVSLADSLASVDASDPATLEGYHRYDLTPGVYCDGVEINSLSDVHLSPGVYDFKDGPLKIDFGARLIGENVGLYFTGSDAFLLFKAASIIYLTAPKSGLMSGLLIWEDRNNQEGAEFSILSSNARQLLGAIYLPRGPMKIASTNPVDDESAYTAIVSRRLEMEGAPTLVLNADYASTDIPVPEGIGPTGGQVFLRD